MIKGIEMDKIVGYDWADIQRAQQGGKLAKSVDLSKPVDHSLMPGDLELFEQYGIAGLQAKGFAGVVDRLARNGYK